MQLNPNASATSCQKTSCSQLKNIGFCPKLKKLSLSHRRRSAYTCQKSVFEKIRNPRFMKKRNQQVQNSHSSHKKHKSGKFENAYSISHRVGKRKVTNSSKLPTIEVISLTLYVDSI